MKLFAKPTLTDETQVFDELYTCKKYGEISFSFKINGIPHTLIVEELELHENNLSYISEIWNYDSYITNDDDCEVVNKEVDYKTLEGLLLNCEHLVKGREYNIKLLS